METYKKHVKYVLGFFFNFCDIMYVVVFNDQYVFIKIRRLSCL